MGKYENNLLFENLNIIIFILVLHMGEKNCIIVREGVSNKKPLTVFSFYQPFSSLILPDYFFQRLYLHFNIHIEKETTVISILGLSLS